jgi:hypothetical protein
MDNQQIFDKVVDHLVAQGGPAVNNNGNCRYRAPNGFMCAAGCLINDEAYSPEIEGKQVWHSAVHTALVQSGMYEGLGSAQIGGRQEMLERLQAAHDGILAKVLIDNKSHMDEFLERARMIAVEYGLDSAKVEQHVKELDVHGNSADTL